MERRDGHIKFYNAMSQYGFLTDNVTGKDYFFCKGDFIGGVIKSRGRVTFEVVQGRKGPKAAKIQIEKSLYEE
jgi:cold shock CspA family protein